MDCVTRVQSVERYRLGLGPSLSYLSTPSFLIIVSCVSFHLSSVSELVYHLLFTKANTMVLVACLGWLAWDPDIWGMELGRFLLFIFIFLYFFLPFWKPDRFDRRCLAAGLFYKINI